MEDIDPLDAANAIQRKLEESLRDLDTQSVMFSRDEAILTLGLVSALIDAMQADEARKPGHAN